MSDQKKKKRNFLKNMVFDEVSLVGGGANQHADVSIFKTADRDQMMKISFNEAMQRMTEKKYMQEFMEDVFEQVDALRYSFYDIMDSDDYPDKVGAMNESMGQFISALRSMTDDEDIVKGLDEILEKQEFKTEAGKKFPASDFAYVPDRNKPSTWKLKLTSTPGGKPDSRIVGAAVAALGPRGYRGNRVQLPSAARSQVKAKVRRAWLAANPDKSPEDVPEAIQKTKGEIKMEKQLEFFKSINGEELEFFKGLSEEEQSDLFKQDMTMEQLLARLRSMMKQMGAKKQMMGTDKQYKKSADEGVNKADDESMTIDGATIHKSEVGAGVFAVLKAQTARVQKAEENAALANNALIQKQLEETAAGIWPNLPGSNREKGALLKSINGMPEETRVYAEQVMKTANEHMEALYKESGSDGEGAPESAVEKLNKMATKHATDNNMSFAKAYDAITQTPEGSKLYAESLKQ